LGHNVKLLTYISIFYMPLGVCAGMWSINAEFGLTLFGIVTVVVAVTTYMLVANLNNIVQASRTAYAKLEGLLVEDMIERSHTEYRERKGREFRQFRPNRSDIMPSKWYILWYATLTVARQLGFRRAEPGAEDISAGNGSLGEQNSTSERSPSRESNSTGERSTGQGAQAQTSAKTNWLDPLKRLGIRRKKRSAEADVEGDVEDNTTTSLG
jgi:hypothetical protein